MHRLTLYSCIRHVLLLCGLALLCCACARGGPDEEAGPRPASKEANDSDYACSYFYFLWGRHAELMLSFEEALEAYEKALICDPQAAFISGKIPILLLRLERTDEAANWLRAYLAGHPDETGMRMLYASVLLRQKKNTEAMQEYQHISELHPDDPGTLLLLAEMYLMDNQAERARQTLSHVLELSPDSYSGHVMMARLCVIRDDTEAAAAHYQRALSLNWSADLQMELADLFLKEGREEEAIALYQDILRRDETDEEARIALAQAYLTRKNEAAALEELKLLRNYVSEPQRVDLSIARLYARQKHYDKAMELTREVLREEELPAARYFLAILLAQDQRYQEALKHVERIGKDDLEFREALPLRIRLLQELRQPDKASALAAQYIDTVQARSPELYLLFAGLHQMRGQDDQARAILHKGLAFYPENEQLLYEYGLLLETSGDHAAALRVMQEIIVLNPRHAEALNFVGYVWAEQKVNLEKALEYTRQAVALKPESGHIHDSLGWVYYRMGRLQEAIGALEKAVRLSPDDPLVCEHLGDAYSAAGQTEQALDLYGKARQGAGDDRELKKRIQDKIHRLQGKATP